MARKKAAAKTTKHSIEMYSIVDKKKVRVSNPHPESYTDARGVKRYRLAGEHGGRKIVRIVSKEVAMQFGKPVSVKPKAGGRKRKSCKAKFEACEAKRAARKGTKAKKPASKKPASKKPASKKPASKKPKAKKPAAKKPAKKAGAKKAGAKKAKKTAKK